MCCERFLQQRRCFRNHQVQVNGRNFGTAQCASRSENHLVVVRVNCYNIKRFRLPADVESLALPNRVMHNALVLPENLSVHIDKISGNVVALVKQHRVIAALDKILALTLCCKIVPADFLGERFHVFLHSAERENHSGKLLCRES